MTQTVLFVDDDENLLEFLRDVGSDWRYQTLVASSGEEALEFVQEEDVQVAVVDQRMPGMKGVELLNRFREEQPHIVRVMMTGHTDLQSAMDAINQGAVFRFFRKPFELDQLRDILADAMEEFEQNQARKLLLDQLESDKARRGEEQTKIVSKLALFRVDITNGKILSVNNSAVDLTGKPEADLIETDSILLFPNNDYREFTRELKQTIGKFGVCYTQIELPAEGEEEPELYNVTGIPLENGSGDFNEILLLLSPDYPLSSAEITLYNYVRDLEDSAELMDRGLKFLYEMSKKVATMQDFDRFVQSIFSDLKEIIGFDLGFLATFQENNNAVFVLSEYQLDEETRETIIGEFHQQYKNETGAELPNIPLDMEVYDWDGNTLTEESELLPDSLKANISIPLKAPEGDLLGVLYIGSYNTTSYTGEEVRLFATFSASVALVLHVINNLSLFQQVKEQAIKDGMTGLYNRRYFEEQMRKELERSSRYNNDLSFLILDIDHFKSVNDTYGHLNGDEILKKIAHIILDSSRNIDIPIRYGGEEFVIILPETHLEDAHVLAERLRKRIEEHAFQLTGEVAKKTPEISITVSIGLSHVEESEEISAEELVERGDKALYFAKEHVRNQVVDYPSIESEAVK
ncbi:MAG: Response regulator PleD [Candidatus Marinimicrobia bacterium]|nr:Response regulator PleD [Candidatus Neomarinimicrobiota bacterium]